MLKDRNAAEQENNCDVKHLLTDTKADVKKLVQSLIWSPVLNPLLIFIVCEQWFKMHGIRQMDILKKGTEHQAFCPCKLSSLLVIQSMCLTGLQYTHVLWNVHVFLKGFSIIRKSVPRNPARLTYSAWYHFQHTIYFFSFNYCLRYHIMKSSKCIIKFIHNVSYDLQSSTGVLDFKFTEMWCQTQLLAIGFLIVYQFW